MATPTLAGESLAKLLNIKNTLNANIITLPMPEGGSDEAEVFDMLGPTVDLTLSGVFVGTTSSIKSTIDTFEAIVDNTQDNSINFVSDQTGTISCKIANIVTNWDVSGVGNKCEYTIRLMKGV